MELVDTSVWARKRQATVRAWFDAAVLADEIAVCDMVALELLHSASTPQAYMALEQNLRALPWLAMDRNEWDRALEVHARLAAQGGQLHRTVKHADLLIAAAAERHGVPLVHYDHDYDTIVTVTGQQARWIAPRGSIP